MPLDPRSLSANLFQQEDGIWLSPTREAICFPAGGHVANLAVEDRSFWFQHRSRCIISMVKRFTPRGLFLDIGGGNGYVAKGLTDAGIDCALIEPGLQGALAARARGIDPVICARLEDMEKGSASVAAAGMFDVLEHIEHEADILRTVHDLLQPGGRLFLTVPAYPWLYCNDDRAGGHFRRYTRSSLSKVLVEAGFRVAYASYIFGPLPPAILLFRTLPSWLGMSKDIGDPDRIAAEHTSESVASRLLARILAAEYGWIKAGRTLPMGGSCLCVATRVAT